MFGIGEVVIAGGGPVGSFTAVLTSLLGLPVVVYEKRETFTREINVKITPDFFEQVQNCIRLQGIDDVFFHDLSESLAQKKYRILIKELESVFKQKALSLGAKYVLKEVASFDELFAEHKSNQPIIIDCTGRKSVLRTTQFGEDDVNMEVIPLESAMHIKTKS
jgi:flavin-dependent dehydrogenase